MFAASDVIYAYTRKQAVEDGEQVLLEGKLAVLGFEHYKHPIYLTRSVYELIERAVNNPRWCNDWEGIIHDILWMSRTCGRSITQSSREFTVIIKGAGRKSNYNLRMECGPTDIDNPDPCMTIMLPEES